MDRADFERLLKTMPMAMEKMDEIRDAILLRMSEDPLKVAKDMTVVMCLAEIMVANPVVMAHVPDYMQKWLKDLYSKYGIVV